MRIWSWRPLKEVLSVCSDISNSIALCCSMGSAATTPWSPSPQTLVTASGRYYIDDQTKRKDQLKVTKKAGEAILLVMGEEREGSEISRVCFLVPT